MYKFKEEVTKIAVTLAQKCPWSQKASNEVCGTETKSFKTSTLAVSSRFYFLLFFFFYFKPCKSLLI